MTDRILCCILFCAILAGIVVYHLAVVRPSDWRIEAIVACMGADQSRERYTYCAHSLADSQRNGYNPIEDGGDDE